MGRPKKKPDYDTRVGFNLGKKQTVYVKKKTEEGDIS